MALVTIAILAAAVVQFTYDSRVQLAIASNERDRLKSYFLARSSLNLSTLLLEFQFALQSESSETEDDMGQLIGRAMRRSNFQMYQYVDLLLAPFSSGSIDSPIGGLDLASALHFAGGSGCLRGHRAHLHLQTSPTRYNRHAARFPPH